VGRPSAWSLTDCASEHRTVHWVTCAQLVHRGSMQKQALVRSALTVMNCCRHLRWLGTAIESCSAPILTTHSSWTTPDHMRSLQTCCLLRIILCSLSKDFTIYILLAARILRCAGAQPLWSSCASLSLSHLLGQPGSFAARRPNTSCYATFSNVLICEKRC
jgi:hypothetical protein